MYVLVACEESQRVCLEFRKLGHRAYSCDVVNCSGGFPQYHIKQDVIPLLNGYCKFKTCDNKKHILNQKWDLIVAFPPCTYLSNVATRSHSIKCTSLEEINKRTKQRIKAMAFFMKFVEADCDKIAIENPVGVMNTCYRKPDQIIHPYMFAKGINDTENYVTKRTCLWLKGLPLLQQTNNLPKPDNKEMFGLLPSGKTRVWEDTYSRDGTIRSKTFTGIAKAIAEQWG